MDHDSDNAPRVSPGDLPREKEYSAFRAAGAVEFFIGTDRLGWCTGFHLVGPQFSHRAACWPALAHFHHALFSRLEAYEPASTSRTVRFDRKLTPKSPISWEQGLTRDKKLPLGGSKVGHRLVRRPTIAGLCFLVNY